ncbi:MAG: hypothetical protein HY743_12950 [Deltaproteobacteria bacterium]|nr:hypothetical protein [Deltaproteobacteria bacterium]
MGLPRDLPVLRSRPLTSLGRMLTGDRKMAQAAGNFGRMRLHSAGNFGRMRLHSGNYLAGAILGVLAVVSNH